MYLRYVFRYESTKLTQKGDILIFMTVIKFLMYLLPCHAIKIYSPWAPHLGTTDECSLSECL